MIWIIIINNVTRLNPLPAAHYFIFARLLMECQIFCFDIRPDNNRGKARGALLAARLPGGILWYYYIVYVWYNIISEAAI
jgi:hypothetical protein